MFRSSWEDGILEESLSRSAALDENLFAHFDGHEIFAHFQWARVGLPGGSDQAGSGSRGGHDVGVDGKSGPDPAENLPGLLRRRVVTLDLLDPGGRVVRKSAAATTS